MKAILLLLLSLWITPAAAADDDEPARVHCKTCKHVGRRPCKEHKKAECELELNAQYCSFVADCEACEGVGWVDCDRCENPAGEEWLAARRRSQAELAEEHRNLDEEMRRTLLKAASEHFVVVWDLEDMKVGRKRLDGHELLHLYLDRLETLFDDYVEIFDAGEGDFQKRLKVMVWWLEKDQLEASLRFCNNGSKRGVKLLGSTPIYSVCGNRQNFKDDETLHRSVIHNVSHLMLSHHSPSNWVGNIKGGWADAGVAHYFEERYFQLCTNYCYTEGSSLLDFKGGRWKPAIRKMVAMGDAPPVAQVFTKNTDTLTLPEHAVSFSYVDYLIHLDGAKANRLFRRLRGKTPTRDALKEVYGLSVLEFEEAWGAWVVDTYPAR